MKKIILVMTTDKNYIMPTRVTLYSILDSAKDDTFYEIHIMCDKELDTESKENILELLQYTDRIQIEFNDVSDYFPEGIKAYGRFSIASYFRLFISQVVDADKCIFIDGDTIVRIDLGELYDIDISDYYVAGARNTKKLLSDNYKEKLDIPSLDEYINAGVLIFNLKKIREDNINKKFVEAIPDNYRMMDQDIINKYCFGKIKVLPLKYNFFTEYYGIRVSKIEDSVFTDMELQEAEREWKILHYTGTLKTWLCTRLKVNQIWWQYAERALRKEDYIVQVEKAREFEKESDWTYILDRINRETNIVIVGFSEIGKKLFDILKRLKPKETIVICDNDDRKYQMHYQGVQIQSVEKTGLLYPDAIWIVASQTGYDTIKKQLIGIGVEGKKVIRYVHKSEIYYEGLDERYRKYEMQMLEKISDTKYRVHEQEDRYHL